MVRRSIISATARLARPFHFLPSNHNRQQQVGGTIGDPLKRNKIFFFTGFDQHIFHVPNVVEFLNGSSQVVPQPSTGPYSGGDYEATDQALVFAAAAQLTSLAGEYPAAQIGNSSYAKLDINLNPRNQPALRVNTTRDWGSNNVFLDPASPTYDSISNNGEEHVSTETANVSLTSSITSRLISHFRAQFSRDQQQSYSNSSDVLVKIPTILDGVGRSNILPRQTREHRLHLAETLSFEGSRNTWKFGGDARAMDDGQGALVAGQPATVQNSYVPSAERGPSVTDQRHRFVVGFSAEPRFFHRGHSWAASSMTGRFHLLCTTAPAAR
jgi:hypothetical protein